MATTSDSSIDLMQQGQFTSRRAAGWYYCGQHRCWFKDARQAVIFVNIIWAAIWIASIVAIYMLHRQDEYADEIPLNVVPLIVAGVGMVGAMCDNVFLVAPALVYYAGQFVFQALGLIFFGLIALSALLDNNDDNTIVDMGTTLVLGVTLLAALAWSAYIHWVLMSEMERRTVSADVMMHEQQIV